MLLNYTGSQASRSSQEKREAMQEIIAKPKTRPNHRTTTKVHEPLLQNEQRGTGKHMHPLQIRDSMMKIIEPSNQYYLCRVLIEELQLRSLNNFSLKSLGETPEIIKRYHIRDSSKRSLRFHLEGSQDEILEKRLALNLSSY